MLSRQVAITFLATSSALCIAGGPFQVLTGPNLGFTEKGKRYMLGALAAPLISEFGPAEQIAEDTFTAEKAKTWTREEYEKAFLAYTKSHTYVNDGITIVEGRDGCVKVIIFQIGPAIPVTRTDTGIGFGSSLREIQKVYGEPVKTRQNSLLGQHHLEVFYRRGEQVLVFSFEDGRLATIQLVADYLSFLAR